MSQWQRVATYLVFTLCALSGAVYLLLHEGPPSLAQSLGLASLHAWLVTHGVSAAIVLLLFGAALPLHVNLAWRARRNRYSGALMLLVLMLLMGSGLLLYYASEALRQFGLWLHWLTGAVALLVFPLHVLLGRRVAGRV
jgi:hypothetical protein